MQYEYFYGAQAEQFSFYRMPSHLRCAAGRAIQAWASIWIVRALSNIATGRRTCLFPQAAQPPIGMQQT